MKMMGEEVNKTCAGALKLASSLALLAGYLAKSRMAKSRQWRQKSRCVNSSSWVAVGSDIPGTGTVADALDHDATNSAHRYYRVLVVR